MQKGGRVQPQGPAKRLVAGQQHESYKQLINKTCAACLGQLVGDLWSAGGLSHSIPHREQARLAYAPDPPESARILPNRVVSFFLS